MKLLILGGCGFIGKSIANYFSNCGGFKTLLPSKAELDVLNLVECRRFLKDKRPDCVVHCVVNYNSMKETLIAYFNIVSCKQNYDKLVYFGSGAEYNPKRYKPLMAEDFSQYSFPEENYPLGKWLIGKHIENNNKLFHVNR